MRRFTAIITLVVTLLLCCQCGTSSQLRQAKKGAKTARFEVLDNYYVRNNIGSNQIQRLVIDNEEDFNAYFGPAAIMGGKPTDINWKKQYVVAVLLPETRRPTMVTPLEVKRNDGNVIFKYQVIRGVKGSHTIVPFAAIALDRPESPQQIEHFFIEK
jgi:hypothetical protein